MTSIRPLFSSCRTIFRDAETNASRFEDYSALPDMWWISVRYVLDDLNSSDEELMDIAMVRLRAHDYVITHSNALQQQYGLWTSFPVMNPDLQCFDDWVSLAVTLARHYQQEIVEGRLSVDRDYLLGAR
jgi:hypothetical protein